VIGGAVLFGLRHVLAMHASAGGTESASAMISNGERRLMAKQTSVLESRRL
jgi:hypothetical protein